MKKIIIVLSLLVLAACTDSHEHMSHDHHETVEAEEPIPGIDLVIHEESSGWNLQLVLENFELAPQAVGSDHIANQGHAHLYIDGNKLTRLYGEWFYLSADSLSEGSHQLTVKLSSNDHKEYIFNGQPISDTATITK